MKIVAILEILKIAMGVAMFVMFVISVIFLIYATLTKISKIVKICLQIILGGAAYSKKPFFNINVVFCWGEAHQTPIYSREPGGFAARGTP